MCVAAGVHVEQSDRRAQVCNRRDVHAGSRSPVASCQGSWPWHPAVTLPGQGQTARTALRAWAGVRASCEGWAVPARVGARWRSELLPATRDSCDCVSCAAPLRHSPWPPPAVPAAAAALLPMAADIRSRSAGPVDDDDVVMSFEPPPPPLRPTPQPAEPQLDEFGLPPTRARSYSYDEERDGEVLEPVVVPLPRVRSEEAEAAPVPIASPGPKRKKKATEATPAASAESTSTKVKPTETKPTETKPTETKSAEMKPPTETAADKRASMASLPERDRKTNEVKMFSEDPKDPHMPAGTGTVSEWSHQQQVPLANSSKKEETKIDEWDGEWQTMPAYASQDLYDDNGRLIAKAIEESDDENPLGGASKGYTRVYDDEDAESATSMDENTQYLFKEDENDDASRNPLSQMQATKELLTEGQRVAYVGVCRLAMREMQKDVERYEAKSRTVKKGLVLAVESMKMWSQKMMVRLYTHMEISPPGLLSALICVPADTGQNR